MTDISIIIPVHNGDKWVNNCMESIAAQNVFITDIKLEIVVYDDGSTDETVALLNKWSDYFKLREIELIITGYFVCKGVGAAKNGAVKKSTGRYLCFQDIDDTMRYDRILLQYQAAKNNSNALIGSKLKRTPPGSTPRFMRWANNLTPEQLNIQIYTSNGPTVLMPTWFCHRSIYDKVGGFVEVAHGAPEDLIFFHAHLDQGGEVIRVNEELVTYTYHESSATFTVSRESIWNIQLDRIQNYVLSNWDSFIIWNAGKAGRKVVRKLNPENLKKVKAFCDIDPKKIGRQIELFDPIQRRVNIKLPVIHFSEATPPLLICMKLDLTNGEFEANLNSLNLLEGIDYVLFS